MRGKARCRKHGGHSNGRGVKKDPTKRKLGQLRNHQARQVRRSAQAELDRTELHPETFAAFRQLQLGQKLVYQADVPVLMLLLDKYLKGKCDRREWLRALDASCK